MRKPRYYDAELKMLDEKVKHLKARKLEQLGEMVVATRADALPIEQLAGALLIAATQTDAAVMEAQRTRGAAFFQAARRARRSPASGDSGSAARGDSTPPAGPSASAP